MIHNDSQWLFVCYHNDNSKWFTMIIRELSQWLFTIIHNDSSCAITMIIHNDSQWLFVCYHNDLGRTWRKVPDSRSVEGVKPKQLWLNKINFISTLINGALDIAPPPHEDPPKGRRKRTAQTVWFLSCANYIWRCELAQKAKLDFDPIHCHMVNFMPLLGQQKFLKLYFFDRFTAQFCSLMIQLQKDEHFCQI